MPKFSPVWTALLMGMTLASLGASSPALAGLDDYLKVPEPAFAWTSEGTRTVAGATVHSLKLTSQIWHGITWTHNLSVVEPAQITHPDAALLFITGGSMKDGFRDKDAIAGLALANACGARVVVLPQVPNQPLLGDKFEDALIVETFVRYLETKDETWPLLFPMVKSAVKAMDAAQAFAQQQGKPLNRFVVTGASKRGWTTWLTGAVDPRVKAIAPMVIPTLNMPAQNAHQLENFNGRYSDQIRDYTDRGIVGRNDPVAVHLTDMIDPFAYRDRLALPKLQINGTNDPYWTLDSMNLYWDDLPGPRWAVYLPNAGHGLDQHRDYAISGVGALFRHVIGGAPFPKLSWTFSDDDAKGLNLAIESDPAPRSAQTWSATAPSLDFRKSPWTATPLEPAAKMNASAAPPESGNVALFADLQYEIDGLTYHLSTQLRQTNRKSSP